MVLASGVRVGLYVLRAQIGAGGMGEVYQAHDARLNRDVALKILPESFALDPDRLARFRREAQVLASLNHPNIASIYGFEESDGVHALVLELVEGPTLAEQDFHTDGADIIGLLCLRTSKSGGASRIVSSVTVFNEVLRRRPDLAPVLFRDFYWHYFEPQMPAPVHFVRPICSRKGGGLNTFFIPWYIRRAQELPDVPPMTAEQTAALELLEATANDPSLYLDMEFLPGDIQLLKNSVILHKRTTYEDWEDPARKRHLLRLWLSAPDFDDGDEQLRGGIRLGRSS